MGSGIALQKAFNKYGKENFKKEILFELDSEPEMDAKEREIVDENMINNPMCYNMRIGGEGGFSKEEAKRGSQTPQSIAHRFDSTDPNFIERCRQIGMKSKGRKLSEEHKQKIREYRTGRKLSEKHQNGKKRKQTRKLKGVNNVNYMPRILTKIQQPDGKIIQTNNLEYYRNENKLGRLTDAIMASRKNHIILEKINIRDLPNKDLIPKEPFIIGENF